MAEPVSSRATPFYNSENNYAFPQICQYGNLFSESNSSGALAMSIAENNLCRSEIIDKLCDFKDSFTADVCNYTSPSGLPQFKSCFNRFLAKYIYKECIIEDDELICASGCVALLHQLAVLLFEAGDAVMIPTPYYPAFIHDFKNVGGVKVVDILMSPEEDHHITNEMLEDAYQRGIKQGSPVKALLLCNPANPTGKIYSAEEYDICCAFCHRYKLHIICDEVYALSVYDAGAFTSWATLAHRRGESGLSSNTTFVGTEEDDGKTALRSTTTPPEYASSSSSSLDSDYIHFLWSLSKDMGGSGMRVGVLYSKNKKLLRACGGMNDMCMISNIAQQVVLSVLNDHSWIDAYLEINRKRLRECYTILARGLKTLSIDVFPSKGGIFVFANLQTLFLFQQKEALIDTTNINDPNGFYSQEIELENRLRDVLIFATPGRACHCQTPGWFRFCYAWTSVAGVIELVARITMECRKVQRIQEAASEV